MKTQETFKRTGSFLRNSATIKIFMIGILVLLLLIPTSMISSMMRERKSRRDSVIQEINQKWGNRQVVAGPFFTIPYTYFYKDEKDILQSTIRYLHILPEKLVISGHIVPQIRYRSIYEAVLYTVLLQVNGNFTMPDLSRTDFDQQNIQWEKALFSVGITDMKGIQNNITVQFNEKQYKAHPGLKTSDIASSGVHCYIPLSPTNDTGSFSFQLTLNGSEDLKFIPSGETTSLKLASDWPSPSFNGAYLPVNREVTDNGFSAEWNVLHLNRNYPQFWTGNRYNVNNSSFGLKLLITADLYQRSVRISKYAIIFIVFTFSAFFLTEIINKKRVHPIQYMLIGLAVLLFYVLLLSISEHLNFDIAYIISACAITTTITCYAKGIIRNNYFTLTICGILLILYTYLYIVLQLEDYALIMGGIGLFIVLTLIMYITRKIDWYSLNKDQD
jgi:inner membrane protein